MCPVVKGVALLSLARHRCPPSLTERLQRPPSRARRNTLPRQPHPIPIIPRSPSNDQQRRRIHQHKLQHRHQFLLHLSTSRRQHPCQRRRILRRPSTRHHRERMRAQAKLRGVKHRLGDLPIGCERPRVRVPRTADLVEAFGATHDQGPLNAPVPQRLCKGASERAFGDAEEHPTGFGGVDERAEEVEEGAEGEGFAVGCEEGEGGVVVWGEDKGEWDAGDGGWGACCWGDEVAVEGL